MDCLREPDTVLERSGRVYMGMGGSPKAQDCLGGVLEDHGGSGRVLKGHDSSSQMDS